MKGPASNLTPKPLPSRERDNRAEGFRFCGVCGRPHPTRGRVDLSGGEAAAEVAPGSLRSADSGRMTQKKDFAQDDAAEKNVAPGICISLLSLNPPKWRGFAVGD